uniref:Solute-binding protein family 3/N-terminal domain-containing protein n=1 Tax=Plectus sambesii TaxID=2011161 RepID=A0A914XJ44_9BILA
MARSANVKNGERRVFRLGYVQSNDFPFLSDCFFRPFPAAKGCSKPGISGEAWTDIARELNWTLRFVKANDYGGYDPEKNGYFSGVLGMVQNGTVDGSIAFASLRPSRDKYFTFTEAPQTYENGLIIGEEIATTPDIILYVFHWLVIGMLGFCALCIASYNYCASKIRPHGPRSRPISAVDAAWKAIMTALLQDKQARPSPMNVVLGLAFTAIYLMYFAGFRSQTMLVTQRRSDLLFQRFFARKDAKVIVRSYSALKPEHRMAIFGEDLPDSDPRILVESDRGKIAQILCQDHNVAHYSRLDVFLATERVPGCVFKTLA